MVGKTPAATSPWLGQKSVKDLIAPRREPTEDESLPTSRRFGPRDVTLMAIHDRTGSGGEGPLLARKESA